jgi:hypothetical protein
MPTKRLFLCICALLIISTDSHGVWFEATGQAAIESGNKALARQNATQEAIKQALLFAGASIKSVQEMTNGLLQQDRFEIRSYGEVNKLELIEETYANGIVSVSIRADIFAQDAQCDASDYQKSIATTHFPMRNRQQAAVGALYALGEILPNKLKSHFEQSSQYAKITQVEPYYPLTSNQTSSQVITDISRKTNSQYVLMGEITEISMEQAPSAGLAFWRDTTPIRHFGIAVSVYNGQTGTKIMQENFHSSAKWQFDMHKEVDLHSQTLWQSEYGQNIDDVLEQISQKVDEEISCLPAYGRILQVENDQLKINIGAMQGVQKGDQLTLFQLNQFQDPKSNSYFQYQLYPVKVTVNQVFNDSAVAESSDGSYLGNIQPNDFVARH